LVNELIKKENKYLERRFSEIDEIGNTENYSVKYEELRQTINTLSLSLIGDEKKILVTLIVI
jgi:hypothetical protein